MPALGWAGQNVKCSYPTDRVLSGVLTTSGCSRYGGLGLGLFGHSSLDSCDEGGGLKT